MDEFWIELLKQAPNTVVNLLIAWFFLKYMTKRDEATENMLEKLGKSCHDSHERVHNQAKAALERNTTALDRNSEALGYSSRRNGQTI